MARGKVGKVINPSVGRYLRLPDCGPARADPERTAGAKEPLSFPCLFHDLFLDVAGQPESMESVGVLFARKYLAAEVPAFFPFSFDAQDSFSAGPSRTAYLLSVLLGGRGSRIWHRAGSRFRGILTWLTR